VKEQGDLGVTVVIAFVLIVLALLMSFVPYLYLIH